MLITLLKKKNFSALVYVREETRSGNKEDGIKIFKNSK